MKNINSYNQSLARRISIYVILFSACVALFTSGIQLYSEYKRDLNSIHIRLDQLERTQVDNIASRVWVLDIQELERMLSALVNLPSIEYVAVYDYEQLLISAGNDFTENSITEEHRLYYEHNDVVHDIGSVVIKASLDEVYSLIVDRALLILMSNGVKTFFVAGFILFIFYHLVTRHLVKISDNLKNDNFLESTSMLTLDRKHKSNGTDELDAVVLSINSMRSKLFSQFQEINSQKNYLGLTLNSIGDAVISTDKYGNITHMNSVAEKLTGCSMYKEKKQSVMSVFHAVNSKTRRPIINLIDDIVNNKKTIRADNSTILTSKDNRQYFISYVATPICDEDSELLGMVLIFHDITVQHELREDIANSKRDMQSIMDHAPAAIYIKDLQGKYLFVNRRYEIIFRLPRKTIIGKMDYDIIDEKISDILKRNDQNVIRAGHALELEEHVPCPDGEMRTYMSVKFPLFSENGSIYAVCGISTDITERKQQENHLRRAQKMDALGKLTSGVAHDYNNMLGIILGYAQLLESSLENKPNLQKYASEIRHAGDRGTKLTKKLLNFSSQDTSESTNININHVLVEEQNMLEKTLTARIKLEMELSEGLWLSELNGGELEDAIVNICINAMHAIGDTGKINIKTANKELEQREAERLGVNAGRYVLLSIEDNGCGIDEQTREKIFDPFFSTKGTKGTGLGLSQVYGFVERSSGAIDVISSPGKGTRLDLYFPCCTGLPDTSCSDHEGVAERNYNGTETVLIVDDEASLVTLMNENLLQYGYNVLTAYNGQDAVEILAKQPVDLVISDIIMPKLDGSQLAVVIKNQYPHVKLQMVSGYVDSRTRHGIDYDLEKQILYKPFSIVELVSRVRTLLDESKRFANLN